MQQLDALEDLTIDDVFTLDSLSQAAFDPNQPLARRRTNRNLHSFGYIPPDVW